MKFKLDRVMIADWNADCPDEHLTINQLEQGLHETLDNIYTLVEDLVMDKLTDPKSLIDRSIEEVFEHYIDEVSPSCLKGTDLSVLDVFYSDELKSAVHEDLTFDFEITREKTFHDVSFDSRKMFRFDVEYDGKVLATRWHDRQTSAHEIGINAVKVMESFAKKRGKEVTLSLSHVSHPTLERDETVQTWSTCINDGSADLVAEVVCKVIDSGNEREGLVYDF